MKIRLVDKTVYDVIRADIIDGRLEIDIQNKTAEEAQEIFSVPGNLFNIELMTDEEDVFGELPGWTVYGGVLTLGDVKTVILSKPADLTEERVTNAESNAIAARAATEEQKASIKEIEEANSSNAQQITDLQLALCEIYEGMEV